jgi:hypothetical protein
MYDFNLCQRYVHMKIGFKATADYGHRRLFHCGRRDPGKLHIWQHDGPDVRPLFHHPFS